MNKKLIYQTSSEKLLVKLEKEKLCFYLGIDPTGIGIHMGHMVTIQLCLDLIKMGHKCIILIGGFTGQIGDPTGKNITRKQLDSNITSNFTNSILSDLQAIFGNNVTYVNNKEWLEKMSLSQFLYYESFISVNQKIKMDTFSERINHNNHLSMMEFSYPELQMIDFCELFNKYNCILQIGGKDQWGNISFGVSYGSKICNTELFGLTTPLITFNGIKIGKSEGNAVFIREREKFYHYCINLSNEICQILSEIFHIENSNISIAKYIDQLYWKDNKFSELMEKEKNRFYGSIETQKDFEIFKTNNILDICTVLFKQSKTYIKQKMSEGALLINGEKYFENILQNGKYKISIGKNVFFIEVI